MEWITKRREMWFSRRTNLREFIHCLESIWGSLEPWSFVLSIVPSNIHFWFKSNTLACNLYFLDKCVTSTTKKYRVLISNKSIFLMKKYLHVIVLQWKQLNVIADNVIIWSMWSDWPRFPKSQITESNVFYRRRRFAYCYHSDNVIT